MEIYERHGNWERTWEIKNSGESKESVNEIQKVGC